MDENEIAVLAQRCITANPVVVVGTGASIPYGVGGMDAMRDHLVGIFGKDPLGAEAEIRELMKLLSLYGLEEALTRLSLREAQEQAVIRHAWEKVHDDDCALFRSIATTHKRPHLAKLFRHLFDSTQRQVQVVTTNYDRLIEYSANVAGYGFTNGFADGYIGQRTIDDSSRVCRYGCHQSDRNRVVHVWKVHGSVDWFVDSRGHVSCYPSATRDLIGVEPVIVAPGIGKYERTHREPFRTVIGEADKALSGAPGFLCIGYGFNDTHIHPKLTERIKDYNKPVVILAKVLTESTKRVLDEIRECEYLAIEMGSTREKSRVYTKIHTTGEEINLERLWDLDVFLDKFILARGG